MEKRYFVIDFKKYDGGDAYRKIVVGHNARRRRAQRPNVDPRRTPKNIELSPLRWNRHDEMLAELNSMAKANGGRRLKRGSSEWFSIVVDASVIEGWSDDDYIRYLRDAERWLRERFAGHPVLHSAIHIDEKKPHLHISFSYFNEETGRWSQRKLASNRFTDLNKILSDFERDVGAKYGLVRGDGATKRRIVEKRAKEEASKRAKTVKIKQRILLSKEVTVLSKKAAVAAAVAAVPNDIAKDASEKRHFVDQSRRIERLERELQETRHSVEMRDAVIERLKQHSHDLKQTVQEQSAALEKERRWRERIERAIESLAQTLSLPREPLSFIKSLKRVAPKFLALVASEANEHARARLAQPDREL